MGTNVEEGNCKMCGEETVLIERYKMQSYKEYCLNEDCRHYFIELGLQPPEETQWVQGGRTFSKEDWNWYVKEVFITEEDDE